jgi:RES domain-containing protein
MSEFKSYRSYWKFEESVRSHRRFIRTPDQEEFLKEVLATCHDKEEIVVAGSLVWRAQVDHGWREHELAEGVLENVPCPHSPKRMKPLQGRAFEGRANPKGIPFLYAATHEKTAIAEVRPWIGALVSVAQLRTTRELRLLNCTHDDVGGIPIFFNEPDAPKRERAVWRDIDCAFARPVTAAENEASYAPTQILAEVFREHRFDGVAYRSSLGPGHNIALFELDAADIINCSLVEIKGVELEYRQAADPYIVEEHSPN